ncbi:hypothetical protein DEU29_10221 [Idiomarina aquatica]|uniref:Flagellar Assembly Protein A N-terminal region domain-containing protein n=1 Tax=Idiomarina aquatica TaxID=1327752 RepID=A0A4R6PQM5_9GAMM|nr:FapA family protein [Idiomarina aquatica]TDP40121.1 hypothetical protein DEU29_10221 [Idiomarina aquatica]
MSGKPLDNVRFQRDGSDVYVFIPASQDTVKAEHLKQAFQLSEFASAQLFDRSGFELIAKHFNEWRKQRERDDTSNYSEAVAQLIDAQISITIDDDDMQAVAEVTSAWGGEPITRPKLLAELKQHGISTGIQRPAINQILQHCIEAPPGTTVEVVVARGKLPKNGRNARFQQLVEDARQRILRPQERDDGTVDMRDLGKQITVNEGDELMRRLPPEGGREGITVKGVKLPAEGGEDQQLTPGEGSQISDSDPDLLIATKVGMPWFTHNSANVDDVLTLKSVDVSTGHVDFKGSVIVSGSVTEGMRVTASGDITVAGYVDSAELNAGGNITVRKGCIGHISKEDEQLVLDNEHFIPTLSSKLSAAGNIWCAYAQYAYLESGLGIIVDKQLTHCHVITSGPAEIGGDDKQARGKIIGGTFETCAPIFAGQLGARAGTRTRFILSPPPPDDSTLDALDSLTENFKATMAKMKRLKVGLGRCNALEDEQMRIKHSRTLINAIRVEHNKLQAIKDDIAVIKASVDNHPTLRVIAAKEVFPGVKFVHQNKNLQMKEHRGGTLFMLQDHQLRMDILR